jgi:hypothetical protein
MKESPSSILQPATGDTIGGEVEVWHLNGLLTATGTWVTIDKYTTEAAAKEALALNRSRSKFSDTVHIRDQDAFAVFVINKRVINQMSPSTRLYYKAIFGV